MGRMYQDNVAYPDPEKITISTWVRLTKDAVDAQLVAAQALSDDAQRAGGVFIGIPIMEFGNSIEPRTGIGVGFALVFEAYLGFGYWLATAGLPSWPDWLAPVWIGGNGTSETGWFQYLGLNQAVSSLDTGDQFLFESTEFITGIGTMFQDVELVLGGIVAFTSCSFFYPRDEDPGQLHPVVNYNGFSDQGINPFNITNGGEDFPRGPYEHIKATPSTWTFQGTLRNVGDNPKVSLKKGDIAQQMIKVNSEILFYNFYPDPKNFTMQPVPTNGPDQFNLIRVDTGGTGKYFGFGQNVVLFPERQGITYGKPATPSTLYFDGTSLKFMLTGRWPEQTTDSDQNIVPKLTFTGGNLALDSWNHIFLTIDLTTMVISGGQDDPTKHYTDDLGFEAPAGVGPPVMKVSPKWEMVVNGKSTTAVPDIPIDFPIDLFAGLGLADTGNPQAKLTVYPGPKGTHWSSTQYFKMQLHGGQIGFPIIPQEVGRYVATGPNAKIEYAYTHIWFSKAIEATEDNLTKFFKRTKAPGFNGVVPPLDKEAAVKEFGTPDIWCYRDSGDDIKFQDNQGTGADFIVVGGPQKNTAGITHPQPLDFRPGPGQTNRNPQTL